MSSFVHKHNTLIHSTDYQIISLRTSDRWPIWSSNNEIFFEMSPFIITCIYSVIALFKICSRFLSVCLIISSSNQNWIIYLKTFCCKCICHQLMTFDLLSFFYSPFIKHPATIKKKQTRSESHTITLNNEHAHAKTEKDIFGQTITNKKNKSSFRFLMFWCAMLCYRWTVQRRIHNYILIRLLWLLLLLFFWMFTCFCVFVCLLGRTIGQRKRHRQPVKDNHAIFFINEFPSYYVSHTVCLYLSKYLRPYSL